MKLKRRAIIQTAAASSIGVLLKAKAQPIQIRWGEVLPNTHPQVLMAERTAKDIKEKTNGRIDIQVFPAAQLGSGKDMIEAVSAGALQFTTDGAGQLGAFLPQVSVFEAPYLWRDAPHLAKAVATPLFAKMNVDLIVRRGLRMLNITYYGKRHLTTGSKAVKTPADMQGFKLRVPPIDVFRAMADAWGAKATPIAFGELYLALSQGAVDGQENPLPTIQSGKLFEVQKHLVLTEHIITPRMVITNETFWRSLKDKDRELLSNSLSVAAMWQNVELMKQETTLIDTFKSKGMSIHTPDIKAWRKPVLDTVPRLFAEKWGKGTFESLAAL